jgi:hypothetical protein
VEDLQKTIQDKYGAQVKTIKQKCMLIKRRPNLSAESVDVLRSWFQVVISTARPPLHSLSSRVMNPTTGIRATALEVTVTHRIRLRIVSARNSRHMEDRGSRVLLRCTHMQAAFAQTSPAIIFRDRCHSRRNCLSVNLVADAFVFSSHFQQEHQDNPYPTLVSPTTTVPSLAQ